MVRGSVRKGEESPLTQPGNDLFYFEVEVLGSIQSEIGMNGGGPDPGESCGMDGVCVLAANGLLGAGALQDVAAEAALEAEILGGFHVDAQVVERKQIRVDEGEEAFHDDQRRGVDGFCAVEDAGVRGKVVEWALDGFSAGECGYMRG